MSAEAKKVYNGIVLLTGYLQRLYVFENIQHQLNLAHNQEQLKIVKELFDDTVAMLPIFEETKELVPTQREKLQIITAQVEEFMNQYFKEEPLSFYDKLAYVGSSLYAEACVNAGIIRLGEIFHVKVNKDFIQRAKYYEERIQFIDIITQRLKNQEPFEEQAREIIEQWFLNIMKNKTFILNDIKMVDSLIGFSNKKD